jgi:hypothetical protein
VDIAVGRLRVVPRPLRQSYPTGLKRRRFYAAGSVREYWHLVGGLHWEIEVKLPSRSNEVIPPRLRLV